MSHFADPMEPFILKGRDETIVYPHVAIVCRWCGQDEDDLFLYENCTEAEAIQKAMAETDEDRLPALEYPEQPIEDQFFVNYILSSLTPMTFRRAL